MCSGGGAEAPGLLTAPKRKRYMPSCRRSPLRLFKMINLSTARESGRLFTASKDSPDTAKAKLANKVCRVCRSTQPILSGAPLPLSSPYRLLSSSLNSHSPRRKSCSLLLPSLCALQQTQAAMYVMSGTSRCFPSIAVVSEYQDQCRYIISRVSLLLCCCSEENRAGREKR